MRVALAQVAARVGDFARNLDRLAEAQAEAKSAGADVVVFPEMSLVGYPPRDLLFDPGFWRPPSRPRARRRGGRPAAHPASSAAWPARQSAFRITRRSPTPRCSFREERSPTSSRRGFFRRTRFSTSRDGSSPGRESEPFELAGRRVGALVCEDVWDEGYPAHPAADLASQGAETLFALVASPFRVGIPPERLRAARRHRLAIAFVNAVGAQDELIFDGGSFALSSEGEGLVRLPRFAEEVATVDLDETAGPTASGDERGTDAEAELFAALSFGVRGFVEGNGVSSVVLGLSGGVDSALVAAIAVEAVGPEKVVAIHVPSRFTDLRSTQAAREIASSLRIRFEVRPLEPLLAPFEAELADLLDAGPAGRRTHENLQARLRMTILAAFVNRHGGLLLNASNKTELALGYGTLWGDLAGLLAPIGDLPKTDVCRLSRWVALTRGTIPPYVLERAPTAELSAGQVDPFDYDDVAPRVEVIVANRAGAFAASEPLRAAIRRAEGKRVVHGIVLKVSEWAFGSGRLVPVTRSY
ncbi:MAG: NAD(+) synthase [Holophagales bacterium]|nr:NAD(+) synthase [Holophagales bacterium]